MNRSKKNRVSNRNPATFQQLESRQMQAVDLAITGMTVGPKVTSAGQSFEITYTVKNQGNSATTFSTYVRNALSRDSIFGNADDILLDTEYYKPSIPAGGTVTFTVKSGTGISQEPGYFRVGGIVDSVGLIDESNEKNNRFLSGKNALVIADFLDNDSIVGTDGNDKITLAVESSRAIIVINGKAWSRPIGFFANYLNIDTGGGKDSIVATETFSVPLKINAGSGNDTIMTGEKADVIKCGSGKDVVLSRAGNDTVEGGSGNDKILAGTGNDSVVGSSGNDTLDAGTGTDKLYGGAGRDYLLAQDGNTYYRDSLWGNGGEDKASADPEDILSDIETLS